MGLRNRKVDVTRMTAGALVHGEWTQTAGTPFAVRCSIQPMSPAALSALPECRRELRSYTLFTKTKLNDVNSQNPDRVTIEDEGEFEVFSCNSWQNAIIPHYEVIVQKVQKTETPPAPEEDP